MGLKVRASDVSGPKWERALGNKKIVPKRFIANTTSANEMLRDNMDLP